MEKRLEKLEQDVKEIKRYIEISEGSSESFDEIMARVKKWEKGKPSNAGTNDGLNKTTF